MIKIAKNQFLVCLVLCLFFVNNVFAGNGFYTVTTNGITSEAADYTNWKSIVESAQAGTSKDNMTVIDVYNVTFGDALGTEGETVDPVDSNTFYASAWIFCIMQYSNCLAYTKCVFHNCVFNKDWIGFEGVTEDGVQFYFDSCVINYRIYGLNGYGYKPIDVFFNNCDIYGGGYSGCWFGDNYFENCRFYNIKDEKVNSQCGYSRRDVLGTNSFGEPSKFVMKDCEFIGDYPEDDVESIYTMDFNETIIENVNIDFDFYKAHGYKTDLTYLSSGKDYHYDFSMEDKVFHGYIPGKITITIPEYGYTTYSTPEGKNIDVSSLSSQFKAYRATRFVDTPDYTHLYFTSTDKLRKDEGYLLRGTPGKYLVDKDVSGTYLPQGNNGMKRGDGASHPDRFALANKSEGLGFYRLSESVTVPTGKAYLDISDISETSDGSSLAKLDITTISFDDDVTTGIYPKCMTSDNTAQYNLLGQKVSDGYHGYIIRNGKKYFVKG